MRLTWLLSPLLAWLPSSSSTPPLPTTMAAVRALLPVLLLPAPNTATGSTPTATMPIIVDSSVGDDANAAAGCPPLRPCSTFDGGCAALCARRREQDTITVRNGSSWSGKPYHFLRDCPCNISGTGWGNVTRVVADVGHRPKICPYKPVSSGIGVAFYSYLLIAGFDIDGSRSILDPSQGGMVGVQINVGNGADHGHHIAVENCSIHDFGGQGMLIGSGGAQEKVRRLLPLPLPLLGLTAVACTGLLQPLRRP